MKMNKKSKLINIRVSEMERQLMHKKAREEGTTLSRLVRFLVLGNTDLGEKSERPSNNPPL